MVSRERYKKIVNLMVATFHQLHNETIVFQTVELTRIRSIWNGANYVFERKQATIGFGELFRSGSLW